jgi:two-component system, chemotaxis family, CheB/CheR fusion protein
VGARKKKITGDSDKKAAKKNDKIESSEPRSAKITEAEQTPDAKSRAMADPNLPRSPSVVLAEEPRSGKEEFNLGFPVAGIGASAGGLEAMIELLENLPEQLDMAIVFVQHLDPRHHSNLVEILSRAVKLPVAEARDGVLLEKGHIYVIPADRELALMHGRLQLMSRPEGPAKHLPIDFFFRSLAEDQNGNSIGVILSGTGSDGALGMRAIKAEGGIALVQDPALAKFGGMPAAAVATGNVDLILPPAAIAEELVRLSRQSPLSDISKVIPPNRESEAEADLHKVFMLVRRYSGVDFSFYKRTTVDRRLSRRMLLHRIDSLKTYVRFLQQNPLEVRALFDDLLINVTSFFRDAGAYQALKDLVFPHLVEDQQADSPLRVWVPACATGEEAYSIAIAYLEYLGEDEANRQIQIFATDVSQTSIEKARQGIYPENICGEVSAERLQRFFVKTADGYQVNKKVRDLCVFANQNLTKDPPFSHLGLISCRNALIYMDSVLQRRILPILHYALRPSGYLMLGVSETIGEWAELFSLVDKKYKIYFRRSTSAKVPIEFSSPDTLPLESPMPPPLPIVKPLDLEKEVNRLILARYGPCGVVVNEQLDIVRFHGQTGRFLDPTPGAASLNLLKIVRPGLGVDLRTLIQKVKSAHVAARREGLRVQFNGSLLTVNVEVAPVGAEYYLVTFQESPASHGAEPAPKGKVKNKEKTSSALEREIDQLQADLSVTKESLQAIIEEHEATNEELRAANEEIQSSNEELQSTNEELTTAKEELQSTNEELTTLNEELENRNFELQVALSDMNNLLASVNVPVLILDNDLRIRNFAPTADSLFHVIPADCGRPIGELRLGIRQLSIEELEQQVRQVIRNLNAHEEQVQAQDGRWYSLRIRPYRTADNKINGAVLALFDITDRKQIESQLIDSRLLAENLLSTIHEPVIALDESMRVMSANAAFYDAFQVTPRHTEGHVLFDIGNGRWNVPALRSMLEDVASKGMKFQTFASSMLWPASGASR